MPNSHQSGGSSPLDHGPSTSGTSTSRRSAASTQNDSTSETYSEHDADANSPLLGPNTHGGKRSSQQPSNGGYRTITSAPHSSDPAPAVPAAAPTAGTDGGGGDVTWMSLPHKGQLLVLLVARLVEPLSGTSLLSYLYYQLAFFSPELPPSRIAARAGLVAAAFPAAQAVTSVLWGSVADAAWGGRKLVILIGLCGTAVGCLGYGFAENWWAATLFRLLSGALNGNVPVMRTMISEIVKEKKYQSRAFLLMPFCFNVGIIVGPVLGGLLADPVGSYPSLFGPNSTFGGKDGVSWLKRWPYSPPNLLSAIFIFASALLVLFFLEETHDALKDKPDVGIRIGHSIRRAISRCLGRKQFDYTPIPSADSGASVDLETETLGDHRPIELARTAPAEASDSQDPRYILPLRRMFNRNVNLILISHFILAMNAGSAHSIWFLFASTPRFDSSHPIPPSHTEQRFPFNFTGGLGLPPASVGFAAAILGIIGITLQILLYPPIASWLGTLRSYQYSLCIFPIVYFITPYLALVPSTRPSPEPMGGAVVWLAITAVLTLQVLGRTFALPALIILVNNSVPHKSRLGTLHGVSQSVGSVARTLGPIFWAWLYGQGLSWGIVGIAYWGMAITAVFGVVVSSWIKEDDDEEKTEGVS